MDETMINAVEKLKQQLIDSQQVQFYKLAEEKMNANRKVNDNIKTIKMLQKEAVNLEHYHKYEALKLVEQKIAHLQTEIDQLPIVTEFKRAQTEANDLLQSVISEIKQHIAVAKENDE